MFDLHVSLFCGVNDAKEKRYSCTVNNYTNKKSVYILTTIITISDHPSFRRLLHILGTSEKCHYLKSHGAAAASAIILGDAEEIISSWPVSGTCRLSDLSFSLFSWIACSISFGREANEALTFRQRTL